MKKFTFLLTLLLAYVLGATAADFTPASGVKYLIKCKKNGNFAYTNGSSANGVLQRSTSVSEASFFTIESTTVDNKTYFYIRSSKDATQYVYAISATDANDNVGVKTISESETPDETCLWTITTQGTGFNIAPKADATCGWNVRGTGIGQWKGHNNEGDNIWYIAPQVNLDGYYTMKTLATDRNQYLYNDLSADSYTRGGASLPTPLTNNYVWHVTSNNNVLTVTNGQGSTLYHDGNIATPTLNVAWSDGNSIVFGEALNAGNSGRSYKLTTWPDGGFSAADNQWAFSKVENNNVYNVESNIEEGVVTYSTTGEKAKNGGFFLVGSTTPSASDFTAANVENYDVVLTMDGTTVKATYTYNLAGITAKAKEAISHKGVGYPSENSAARKTLSDAIEKADASAIDAALKAYKLSTEDIEMPKDGQAYRIAVPYINGTTNYLYSNGNDIANGNRVGNKADADITDKNDEVFVCHIVNGKYVFATNHGTYLSWADSGDGDKSYNTNAQTASYTAQNDWTIEPATTDKGNGTVTAESRADFFGLVQMKALGKDGSTTYYLNSRVNDAFISQYGADKFYDTGWANMARSCFYQFEEVEYPNEVDFNHISDIEGVSNIATFSAPFATIIPEGVKAYYVSAKGEEATLSEITEAIPANTGVILTSDSGNKATMIPVAAETIATVADNQLGSSAGAEKTLTEGEGYILTNGTEGTAFYPCQAGTLSMNKAYLLGNGSSAIKMNFGSVTGINGIASIVANDNAPIYDLSGRRVAKVAKSGLYIQNGKKFIVK